jgi:STE24 endopeptidase
LRPIIVESRRIEDRLIMPVPLLIALFLAFGTDAIFPPSPRPDGSVTPRLLEASAEVGFVGLVALAFSLAVSIQVRRQGRPTSSARWLYGAGSKVVGALTLGGYAWVIHGLAWPEVIRLGLKLRDSVLIDELLILLPFLLAQMAAWSGLYFGERALRPTVPGLLEARPVGLGRHLVLRARQTWGMFLPSALIFSLAEDLVRLCWPKMSEDPGVQIGLMAGLGAFVMILAPAFVRLNWPTRPLPAGPLRDRLERLAIRFKFRYTDILIWETDGTIVNAAVTGALPFYRYVLLTDALIDGLDPHEVAAVFGHEVGHIHHRHLAFFGFFFVGSMGILTVASDLVSIHALKGLGGPAGSPGETVAQGAITLALGLAYFAAIFGFLSRRFERQADVFGCRVVSCGKLDCPPHPDLYSRPGATADDGPLCPVGIRIFINALMTVAELNGMEPSARSWRHGSINRRIAFLEGLEGKPQAERRFQIGVSWLRVWLVFALTAGLYVAFKTGAIDHLGP